MTERSGPELRSISEFEIRAADNGGWTLHGYASTFNDPYSVTDRFGTFTETILPGAWDRSLANRGHKIHLLASHGGLPLASTNARTMRLETDKRGLAFDAELAPDSPTAQSVASAVNRGDADEMSVGMNVPKGGDTWANSGDVLERSISEASLLEISVVARGANPNTQAAMREAELLAEIRELQHMLAERDERYDPNELRLALQARTVRIPVTEQLARLHALRK
jgi:HK97 family phage prohead protease